MSKSTPSGATLIFFPRLSGCARARARVPLSPAVSCCLFRTDGNAGNKKKKLRFSIPMRRKNGHETAQRLSPRRRLVSVFTRCLYSTPLFFWAAALGSDLKASRCVIPAGAMLRRRGEKEKKSGAGSQRAAAAAAAGCVTVNNKKKPNKQHKPPKTFRQIKLLFHKRFIQGEKKCNSGDFSFHRILIGKTLFVKLKLIEMSLN